MPSILAPAFPTLPKAKMRALFEKALPDSFPYFLQKGQRRRAALGLIRLLDLRDEELLFFNKYFNQPEKARTEMQKEVFDVRHKIVAIRQDTTRDKLGMEELDLNSVVFDKDSQSLLRRGDGAI
jgi:hypothetical protein